MYITKHSSENVKFTNVFLYQKRHPKDGRITGQNMLVKMIQCVQKVAVHLGYGT